MTIKLAKQKSDSCLVAGLYKFHRKSWSISMEVSVTPQMHECEKDRQGGRDGHHGEEIVGSASSFIAALMSPETHRLETAVLFSPHPGHKSYTATDTQKHVYIQSRRV